VRWLRTDGQPMAEAEWNDGNVLALAVVLADARGNAVLLLSNASYDDVPFVLPEAGDGRTWRLRLDSGTGAIDPERERLPAGAEIDVGRRSLQLYSV
jgi:glycogen operon protein